LNSPSIANRKELFADSEDDLTEFRSNYKKKNSLVEEITKDAGVG